MAQFGDRLLRARLAKAHIKNYTWIHLTVKEARAVLHELRLARLAVWLALALGVVVGKVVWRGKQQSN